MAGLCKLFEHSDFGETLDNILRDRLAYGVNDEKYSKGYWYIHNLH